MKFLLLIFLIPFVSKSQELNVDQTLAYINNQLNDKNNKIGGALNNYSYNIKIDKGYLIVIRTITKNGSYQDAERNWHTVNYTEIIEESQVPINDIDNNFYSPYQKYQCINSTPTSPTLFVILLKEKDNSTIIRTSKEFDYTGAEIKKKAEKQKNLFIEFSNSNLICDKLANAFTHLIDLASKDPNYNHIDVIKDNDPFSNPIQKEKENSNTIIVSNTNSVPMTKVGGVYEIPVLINEVLKLNFIFDAGASDVSISPDVALTLIRTGTVTDKDFLGTETYKFADGSTAKSKVFIIKEIQLGNKIVRNVRTSISNSIKAPLLLGQSVLNKFGKVTIDYNESVIIFQN